MVGDWLRPGHKSLQAALHTPSRSHLLRAIGQCGVNPCGSSCEVCNFATPKLRRRGPSSDARMSVRHGPWTGPRGTGTLGIQLTGDARCTLAHLPPPHPLPGEHTGRRRLSGIYSHHKGFPSSLPPIQAHRYYRTWPCSPATKNEYEYNR